MGELKDEIDVEYRADRVSAVSDEEMVAWILDAFGDDLPTPQSGLLRRRFFLYPEWGWPQRWPASLTGCVKAAECVGSPGDEHCWRV